MSSNSQSVSINLTSAQLYWLYAFLLIGDVVLAYVAKAVPSTWGVSGLGVLAIAFFGTLAHDYEDQHAPGGTPPWVTYAVITATAAVIGAIGAFTSDTLLSTVAIVAWLILILQAVFTTVSEDGGANIPQYAETVITTIIGAAISFLTWYGQNPNATLGAIIATIIAIGSSFIHVTATSTGPAAHGAAA